MPATPGITLHVSLEDLGGNQIGSTANPALIRIGLAGFAAALPRIAGTTMVARPGPYFFQYLGTPINISLWGNDQITPANTYYDIAILDADGNVIQAGSYQFTGTVTIDLSSAVPITWPGNVPVGPISANFSAAPSIQDATGTIDGVNVTFTFTAPSSPTPLVAIFSAGIYQSPLDGDYSLAYSGSNTWTITMTTAPVNGPMVVFWFPQAGTATRTVTAPATINVTGINADGTIFCNFSAPGAFTLPSAATAGAGYTLTFKDIAGNAAANNITLTGSVDGAGSYVLSNNYGAVTIRSNGTTWSVLSKL